METNLTKDQKNQLLTLSNSEWARLKNWMKCHYELGLGLPDIYIFLVALSSKQWQNTVTYLSKQRNDNNEKLKSLRSAERLLAHKVKKTEYMRQYMQHYRLRKEQHDGQSTFENSG